MTPIISPQGWDYVLVLTTFALIVVVNDLDRLPRLMRPLAVVSIAAMGLTLYDLLGRRLFYIALDLGVITIGTMTLIASAAVLRIRKAA